MSLYCTNSFNSAVTGHRPCRTAERSQVSAVTDEGAEIKKKYKKCQFFLWPAALWKIHNSEHLWHSGLFLILDHIFYPNTETFWLYVCWNLDMVTPLSPIRRIQNFGEAVTGHKACKIEWIGTVQYLTGHLYAKESFALSHHFKATIYSSFCTKGCTNTLRLYVLNFVANKRNLVVQFVIYLSGGKNGKNGSPVHR